MATKRKRKSSRDASDISSADRKILLEIATHLRDFHLWTIWKGETPPHARPDELNPGGRCLEGARAGAYALQIERILDPFVPDLSPAERRNWAMAMEYHLRKCIAEEKGDCPRGYAKELAGEIAKKHRTTINNVQRRYTIYRATVTRWSNQSRMLYPADSDAPVELTRLQHLEFLLGWYCR